MDEAAIWRSHLRPDERIVWASAFSPAIRKAERARVRLHTGLIAVVSGVLAGCAGLRFYEAAFLNQAQPNLGAAAAAPLILALGVALATLSFWMVRKLRLPPPLADHYAATNQRLLAANAEGQVVQELPGSAVAGAIFDNDRRPTELHILRGGDDQSARSFFIEHVADLPGVKTIIEQTFPETTP